MAEPFRPTDVLYTLSFDAQSPINQARRDLDNFMETCSISSFGEALNLSPEAGVAIGSRLLSLLAIDRGKTKGDLNVKKELFYWTEYADNNVLDLLAKTELANMNPDQFSIQDQLLTDIALTLYKGILHARQTPIITHQNATKYVALNDARMITNDYRRNMYLKACFPNGNNL